MSYVVNLVLKAKPGEYQNLLALFTEILPDTASYKGAEVISCYTDPEAQTLTVHEIWDSKDSQQAYMKWRVETGLVDKVGPMVAAPPAFEEYTHVPF